MGKDAEAKGWGRWLAIAASLVLAGAMIYAQDTTHTIPCCPDSPSAAAAAPPSQTAAPAVAAPQMASAAEVAMLAGNAPVMAQDFQMALPAGIAPEGGLQVKTIWAARVIELLFPEIKTIGGFRQDALRWHPSGLAIDVMIPDHDSPEGIALGNQIAGLALANAKRWGIDHVIWRQKIYLGPASGSWTADLGNETANHYDHVHIATNGGGYPTGRETYFIGSMTPAPSN
ncbi:glycoside hydrolase [Mycobacterium sp. TY815]|uniref:glycoside hydrolase n=1 Tax=Mycobacterium sp. TY815 TaxID=3050581 RepID=UPI0027411641|nr:glycoside hydrolase [Mycobacterium sp. TY815]MDP7702109.1 glycoside hydrolase [Mycobacterium sp. TY815]